MDSKAVQLFILRYLESGYNEADENILTNIPVDKRKILFSQAQKAIIAKGFLCKDFSGNDKPALSNAYVSTEGRAFIRENTPDPLVKIIYRQTSSFTIIALTALITNIIGTVIHILLTLYLTR